MKEDKSSLSQGTSCIEIGSFWDENDLTDFWDQTKETQFELNITSEKTYYALDKSLSNKVQELAQKKGISADTLINLWIQEKLHEQ